jgi:FkbM family methyltransferase
MSLRNLRYFRFNSAHVRDVLRRLYVPGNPYPVWFGPLRGLSLYYEETITFHATLGLLDMETFELLRRVFLVGGLLPANAIIADVGSNIGYYTLWFSQVAARAGQIYAFEPNPATAATLRSNLEINEIGNTEVVESACGDRVGTIDFFVAPDPHCSSLHSSWAGADGRKITASVTTLDEFFAPASHRLPPHFIKIDIEGGGTFALPGCSRIFSQNRPFVLVESHNPQEDRAISEVLCNFDYLGYRLADRTWVTKPEADYTDPDGVRGTLLLIPAEHHARVCARLRS